MKTLAKGLSNDGLCMELVLNEMNQMVLLADSEEVHLEITDFSEEEQKRISDELLIGKPLKDVIPVELSFS